MRVVSEDINKFEEDLTSIFSQTIKSKVKCSQTSKGARIELFFEGELDETTDMLKEIKEAIGGYFRLKGA